MQGQRGIANGRGRSQHLWMIRNRGAVDLRDGLTELLAGSSYIGTRRCDRISRVRQLFGGNGAVRQQSAAGGLVVRMRGHQQQARSRMQLQQRLPESGRANL